MPEEYLTVKARIIDVYKMLSEAGLETNVNAKRISHFYKKGAEVADLLRELLDKTKRLDDETNYLVDISESDIAKAKKDAEDNKSLDTFAKWCGRVGRIGSGYDPRFIYLGIASECVGAEDLKFKINHNSVHWYYFAKLVGFGSAYLQQWDMGVRGSLQKAFKDLLEDQAEGDDDLKEARPHLYQVDAKNIRIKEIENTSNTDILEAAGFKKDEVCRLFKNNFSWLIAALKNNGVWALQVDSSEVSVMIKLAQHAQEDLNETITELYSRAFSAHLEKMDTRSFYQLILWLFMQRAKARMPKTIDLETELEYQTLVDIEILLAFHYASKPNINFNSLAYEAFLQPAGAIGLGVDAVMPSGRGEQAYIDETLRTIATEVNYGAALPYKLSDPEQRKKMISFIADNLEAARKIHEGFFGFTQFSGSNRELNNTIREALKSQLPSFPFVSWKESEESLVVDGSIFHLLRRIAQKLFK